MFKQIAIALVFLSASSSSMAFDLTIANILEKATPVAQQIVDMAGKAANSSANAACNTAQTLAVKRDMAEAEHAVYSASAKVVPAALGGQEIEAKANIAAARKYAAGASSAVLSVGCFVK